MKRGFTLVELLVYASIFAVIGVVLTSIFVVFLRVDVRETASAEVSNQANFILQRIQNYVNNASFLVVNNTGDDEMDGDPRAVPRNYLIIKDRGEINVPNDALSPIVIFKDGDFVKVQRGRGTLAATENLNSNKVKTTNLTFTKVSNPPGRDSVIINLTLEYNQPSLPQKISRTFSLGVGKAFAAVFDTPLEAGASSLDIGTPTNPWRSLFLANDLIRADGALGVVKLGNGSDSFAYLRNGTILINAGGANSKVLANVNETINATLSGATGGDRIFLTPPANLEAGLVFVGATTPIGGGSVDITVRNVTGTDINTSAKNWYFWLVR